MDFFKKKKLVTCAFPYSNGSLHLGHLLEHIQADIWVRYHRMRNCKIFFICSDDSHGTAIMLQAKKLNISPEHLISKILKNHCKTFSNFSISHDYYSSTNSLYNKKLCEEIYDIIYKKKLIKFKKIKQFFDNNLGIFLSDRLIKGFCPFCKSKDQNGDGCDLCGKIYNPDQLIKPYSVLSQTIPILKNSKHIYFNISHFYNFLKIWLFSNVLQSSVLNKTKEWLDNGLKEWCISRDDPYFGFKIPGFLDKNFYVWFDASIGYISCFKEFCEFKKNIFFDEFWNKNSNTELYHFIGKDIINFHCIFWPSILESIDFRKPTKIFSHGYLTFKGKKFSKSKSIGITADDWLSCLDSDSLRYYFSTKLSNNIEDIEMNFDDYRLKINSDIVNNFINLASRSSSFLSKYFFNTLSNKIIDSNLYNFFLDSSKEIENLFLKRKFSLLINKIRNLSIIANRYISKKEPWILIKKKCYRNQVHMICSMGINLFKIIMTFLKPIIPNIVKKSEIFLNIKLKWNDIPKPLLSHKINNFFCLYSRIKKKQIDKLLKKI